MGSDCYHSIYIESSVPLGGEIPEIMILPVNVRFKQLNIVDLHSSTMGVYHWQVHAGAAKTNPDLFLDKVPDTGWWPYINMYSTHSQCYSMLTVVILYHDIS